LAARIAFARALGYGGTAQAWEVPASFFARPTHIVMAVLVKDKPGHDESAALQVGIIRSRSAVRRQNF
jgi:hypothetical protein